MTRHRKTRGNRRNHDRLRERKSIYMRTVVQYEDKDVIVAYKPAGLAVQTAKIGQPDMVSELKNYLKGAYVGVVHRLDQPVEGLLVFGKNPSAAAALSGQLAQKNPDGQSNFSKSYYAVICKDSATKKEVCLTDYILKAKDNRAEIVPPDRAADMGAKKAVLRYVIKEILPADPALIALADICIETGRFHQIRAQMAHAGFPLLGDQKYGTPQSQEISLKEKVKTVALCAYKVSFCHPKTKKVMEFTVDPKGTIFQKFGIFNHH